jgi:IS605 OrfB family transposase
MKKENIRTFESRKPFESLSDEVLNSFADLFSYLQHRLFADIASGKKPGELKNDYLACYDITARQFNSLRVLIEGKISSIQKRLPDLITEKRERVTSLAKTIKRLIKTKADANLIHQKKRRLCILEHQLTQLIEDHKNGTVHCCFGGKKLFNAQFNLEENDYSSHEEWLEDWRKARTNEIFFLGSKDETAGNQTCTATLQPDQTIELRIRLPNALKKYGKYLVISGINFKYGKEELHSLLNSETTQAITWRFKRDEKGWRIFATFDIQPAVCTSKQNIGVIGLDINVNHLALVETDRFGNPISKKVVPYNLYGKNSDQAKAIIGKATAFAVAFAESKNKPLIFEELNFQKKKSELREGNRASYARMLSSFSYGSIISHLKSRALKKGVLAEQVNPAYTSIIGRIKFAKRLGLSIHQAAALTIGRRYLRFSEKAPSTFSEIPDGKDSHVTLSPPVRKRNEHVWKVWSRLSKKLRTALAAHFRTSPNTKGRSKSSLKPAFETEPLSDVVGETPTRESSELLFA